MQISESLIACDEYVCTFSPKMEEKAKEISFLRQTYVNLLVVTCLEVNFYQPAYHIKHIGSKSSLLEYGLTFEIGYARFLLGKLA
jgi:hypothetical protein